MSFRLSKERKKRRYARRKAKRHAKRNLAALSKPAKPAPPAPKPAPAKPAPAPTAADNPTTPPKNTPSIPKPPASLTVARRATHENHKLRARVRLLEKQVARFNEHEKHLGGVLAQLAAARTQIRELSVAMHHVLSQPPHNGRYFDKNYNRSRKWGRTLWECPVRDHDRD